MKHIKLLSALTLLALPVAAFAQAPEISKRVTIYSAEGTKIGRIEKLVDGTTGAPAAVRVIYRGKFLTIPTATLSAAEKGLKTSLTNDDLKKM